MLKWDIGSPAARDLQEGNNGLYFTGSHLCGVSLPNCLEADIA
jgi:hypothetical protein